MLQLASMSIIASIVVRYAARLTEPRRSVSLLANSIKDAEQSGVTRIDGHTTR